MQDDLFSLAHNRILVTGGGSGIGRAVTLELTRRGADVWILGRREEKLAETADACRDHAGKVSTVSCDIRNVDQVRDAFSRINADSPVQALVHGAGEVRPCAAERLTPEIFQDVVQSQLVGAFNIYHFWTRALIAGGLPGNLVCYTSAPGGRETPGLSHSSATKTAMEGLIRTWAVELGQYGIRLNAIAPGLFPMDTTLAARDSFFDVDLFKANVPLGRFGNPAEIVAPTLFMLSTGASYMTGAIIHVDGGLRLRPHFGFTREGLDRFGEAV